METSKSFEIFQLGFSFIMEKPDKFENVDFVLNVFPHECVGVEAEPYQILPSSIHFLRRNHFDFNKLLDKGVTFMSRSKEQELIQKINSNQVLSEDERMDKLNKVHSGAGARLILDHLVNSRKKIIVHNGCLDIFHVTKLIAGSLPENYTEYKQLVRQYFEEIIDTKYLALIVPGIKEKCTRQRTALFPLFAGMKEYMCPLSRRNRETGYLRHSSIGQQHEAGVDAFMTASAYIGIVGFLTNKKTTDVFDLNLPALTSCRNRINVPFTYEPVAMNNDGDDALPDTNKVFIVEINLAVSEDDMSTILKLQYGNVVVKPITAHTAFIVCNDDISKRKVLQDRNDNFRVTSYSDWNKERTGVDDTVQRPKRHDHGDGNESVKKMKL